MFGCRSIAMTRASRCRLALWYSSFILRVSMIFIATCNVTVSRSDHVSSSPRQHRIASYFMQCTRTASPVIDEKDRIGVSLGLSSVHIPVFTAVSTARAEAGVKNGTRIHGPWTRVVRIASYTRVINTTRGHGCHFLTFCVHGRGHGRHFRRPWTRPVHTGSVYRASGFVLVRLRELVELGLVA